MQRSCDTGRWEEGAGENGKDEGNECGVAAGGSQAADQRLSAARVDQERGERARFQASP